MFANEIRKALVKATKQKEIHLEFPENSEHGDYATNIALLLAKKEKQNPNKLASTIVKKLEADSELKRVVERIEIAGPGFINFWLSGDALKSTLRKVLEKKDKYGQSNYLKNTKILLEHTSPNTIKTLHVGHIRNNVLGMAVSSILENVGAKVVLDAINNDRGIHVMKAVWAYQKFGKGKGPGDKKPDQFVDEFYIKGAKEAEKKETKEKMQELLRKWEAGDEKVRASWKKLRDWTIQGFQKTYQRLGSKHDHQWYESDFYEQGKDIVCQGLKKKVFKKLPDGAVLSKLAKYNLPDTIVLRADGTSMYHTQDLRLTQLKRKKFPSDLYIWDIGPEQSLYLKQLFAMCEQLGIGERDDYLHLSYGFVFLKKGGKMSSRSGNIISADWLMDEMVKRALLIIEKSDTSRGLSQKKRKEIAEDVGIGAIKYGFLKHARESDIHFDLSESLSMEGNSGPYLQYTYARIQSVLSKANIKKHKPINWQKLNKEEQAVIRLLPRFEEIVIDAAINYSPNLICNYVFNLAQKYNSFYNKHKILGSESQQTRLALTEAAGQVLRNGLSLLGINTPQRM